MEEKENIQKKTNGFAIAGFICSLVVGTITGLIFSIIGLVKAKKCNSGKGFGIAGIIISILRLLLLVAIIGISFYIVSNNAAGQSAFCDEIYEDRETACTLNTDGTYDCILATCDFGTKKIKTSDNSNKHAKKETGYKSNEQEKEKTSAEEITVFNDTIPTIEKQKTTMMNYIAFLGENVKNTDLTNDQKLALIHRLHDFDNMSGEDVMSASNAYFGTDILLTDGYSPFGNELTFEYNEDTDMFHYTCADCYGIYTPYRYEKIISENEVDGILTIETYGVMIKGGFVTRKIYYDYELQNEIPVDSKYYENGQDYFCGECLDKFMEDNKESLPHFEYKFRVNGNYLTFMEVSKTR